jgi:hypothetical protein
MIVGSERCGWKMAVQLTGIISGALGSARSIGDHISLAFFRLSSNVYIHRHALYDNFLTPFVNFGALAHASMAAYEIVIPPSKFLAILHPPESILLDLGLKALKIIVTFR